MSDDWHVIEQLAVNAGDETSYVLGYDETLRAAIIEERGERQKVAVPPLVMDVLARWWLERRGWILSPPHPEISLATKRSKTQE